MKFMSLVPIACPQSEAELSVMLCTLEAHDISAFVQGGGFGSLVPGPQIPWFNGRRIMVSSSDAARAGEALAIFTQPVESVPYRRPGAFNVLRMILEFLLFGWFVPGSRRRHDTAAPNASAERRGDDDA